MKTQPQPVTEPISPQSICEVYSGRPGCMCGCRGQYYATQAKWEADKAKYHYDPASRVNPKMITRIVNFLNSHLAEVKQETLGEFGKVYFMETDRRTYVAYTL